MTKNYETIIDFYSFIDNNHKELSILKNNLDKTTDSSLGDFEKQFTYKQIVLHCFTLIESSLKYAFINAVISNEMALKKECGSATNMDRLNFFKKIDKNPFYKISYIRGKFKMHEIRFKFTNDFMKEFEKLKINRDRIVHSNGNGLKKIGEIDVQKYLKIVEETLQGLI